MSLPLDWPCVYESIEVTFADPTMPHKKFNGIFGKNMALTAKEYVPLLWQVREDVCFFN